MAYLGTYVIRGDVTINVAEELRRCSMQLVNILSKPADDEVRTECIALCAINISTIAAFVEMADKQEVEKADLAPKFYCGDIEQQIERAERDWPLELQPDTQKRGGDDITGSLTTEQWASIGITPAILEAVAAKMVQEEERVKALTNMWRHDSENTWFHIAVPAYRITRHVHERGDGSMLWGYLLTYDQTTMKGPAEDCMFLTQADAMLAAQEDMEKLGYFRTSTIRIDRWYRYGTDKRTRTEEDRILDDLEKTVKAAMDKFGGEGVNQVVITQIK